MMAASNRSMALGELLAADAIDAADAGHDEAGTSTDSPRVSGEVCDSAVVIKGVCLDTRLAGEGFLYLALAGGTTHGLHFVRQAIECKVVAIAAEPGELAGFATARAAMDEAGVVFIEVSRLKQRAGFIAARFFGHPSKSLTIVAVTGTDGKTSVCHFVQAALAALGTRCGYIGTLGWGFIGALGSTELTTPDAVTLQAMLAELRDEGADVVALEAASHGLAEGRLDALDIDIAVLTNLGRDHLDYHVTLERYREAKAHLFTWPSLRAQVLNVADRFGRELADADLGAPATWVFDSRSAGDTSDGSSGTPGDVQADIQTDIQADAWADALPAVSPKIFESHRINVYDVRSTVSGLQFCLISDGIRQRVSSGLVGHFNVDNLLACFGVLRVLRHAANDACAALEKVTPVPGRMERYSVEGQAAIIVDFAHTPDALKAALKAARQHCAGKLWVVFGCGGDRDPGKRVPMGAAAELADHIIITDDNPRTEDAAAIREQVLGGLTHPASTLVIGERTEAIRHALEHSAASDIIVVAGKGHEDYQIIGRERRAYSDRATVARLLEEVAS